MNTKKTAITIVAAMMAIAMITTVALATNCFEPCGTKIEQCTNGTPTKDAVYALVLPGVTGLNPGGAVTTGAVDSMSFAFHDDGDGAFEPWIGECGYIDTNGGPANVNPAWVEAGDVRLVGHCGQDPNNPVLVCDPNEMNNLLTYPDQRIVGYVDSQPNGYYDFDDPLYLDVGNSNNDGIVSRGDIRLTGYMSFAPYSYVNSSDSDALFMFPLLDPATNVQLVVGGGNVFNDYLGFVDTDCDNVWDDEGADKLYLQQIVIGTGVGTNLPLIQNTLYPFDGFVTIGDFRIYMPPNEDCWPICGTKVKQCDTDAEYPILITGVDVPLTGAQNPNMALRWVDATAGDAFNPAVDDVYIDVNAGRIPAPSNQVENGDVRLTEVCGCPANTLAGQCSPCDVNAAFAAIVAGDQNILGFVDVNGNGRYDLNDSLYLDTSRLGVGGTGVSVVSINDIRLTPRVTLQGSYAAYTPVKAGHGDLFGDTMLRDVAAIGHLQIGGIGVGSANPINSYLGFVDSNCDGEWDTNGKDKLYLQQIVYVLADLDLDGNADEAAINQLDRFASIGDFRLFMPIDEDCWPDCGTKVVECDVDAVYGLMPGTGAGAGVLVNGVLPVMNIVTTSRDCYYVNVYGHAAGAPVGPGAVRLCDCCDNKSNTVVKDCDDDANDPIIAIAPQRLLGYVDINSNQVYDLGDPLYLDTGRTGMGSTNTVSNGDVRLTPRECQGQHYGKYTIVDAADWDAGHGSAVGDALDSPKTNRNTNFATNPTVNWYLGFIDSNCDGMWDVDGEDELYLQQMVPAPVWNTANAVTTNDPQFNLFSTIGDFRLYMPPTGGIVTPDCPADLSSATYGTPDGTVDIYDIAYVIDNWGQSGSSADVSGSTYGVPDGTVDIYDIAYVIDNWGDC